MVESPKAAALDIFIYVCLVSDLRYNISGGSSVLSKEESNKVPMITAIWIDLERTFNSS